MQENPSRVSRCAKGMASCVAATKVCKTGGFEECGTVYGHSVRKGCILAKAWGVNSCSESLCVSEGEISQG